jgi:glycosyltransferase involved in cell wall biosynthesis
MVNFLKFGRKIIREPKITVGISSYNHSKYLEQCIDSVLNQNYKNFDIVIVDDCSSDASNKVILNKYEDNDKITIIYKERNEGISASLNEQIFYAKGDWIAFVDCDDFLPKNALKKWQNISKKIQNIN